MASINIGYVLKTFISIWYWFLVDFFFIYDKYKHGIGIDIKQGCLKWHDMLIICHVNLCLDTSILSIKMDENKNKNHQVCPLDT
jgi:hypothetical protein